MCQDGTTVTVLGEDDSSIPFACSDGFWRRKDGTTPGAYPLTVDLIKEIKEGKKMKKDTLKILNSTLSLKAEGWSDVRRMLKKVQFTCRVHELKWVDVEYEGFTMLVEPDTDIELLATEFEEWKKRKVQEGLPDILWIPFDEIRPYFE